MTALLKLYNCVVCWMAIRPPTSHQHCLLALLWERLRMILLLKKQCHRKTPHLYQEFFLPVHLTKVYDIDFLFSFVWFKHSVDSVGCLASCERPWCMACALDNSVSLDCFTSWHTWPLVSKRYPEYYGEVYKKYLTQWIPGPSPRMRGPVDEAKYRAKWLSCSCSWVFPDVLCMISELVAGSDGIDCITTCDCYAPRASADIHKGKGHGKILH